jgi:hypothetical protein
LYSQFAGKEEGISTLDKEALKLIFNNGKLHIYKEGLALTEGHGGYALFRAGSQWYSSREADWQVTGSGHYEVAVHGIQHSTGISQRWRVTIDEDNRIDWHISLEGLQADIDEYAIELMVPEAYTRWQTPFEEGIFCAEEAHSGGRAGYLGSSASALAVCGDKESGVIPCLIALEEPSTDFISKIAPDALYRARLLRFSFPLKNLTAGRREAAFHVSFSFGGQVRKKLIQVQEKSAVCCGPLTLSFHDGAFSLFRAGRAITKAEHMGMVVYADNRWHTSRSASWSVIKENADTLTGEGSWIEFAGKLCWKMRLVSSDCFEWEIFFEAAGQMKLHAEYVRVLLSEEYDSFSTYLGKELFPGAFGLYERDLLQRCIGPGTVIFTSSSKQLFPLRFSFSGSEGFVAKVLNSDISQRARVFQVERAQPEADIVPAGEESHRVKIKGEFTGFSEEADSSLEIPAGGHIFTLSKGKGTLKGKDAELTKHMGMYSSIKMGGRWYDSCSHASWSLKPENKISCYRGIWHELPLRQVWRVAAVAEGIRFEAVLLPEETIGIDEYQFNIMLSERYSHWDAGSGKTVFLSFRDDVDDSWHTLWEEKHTGSKDIVVTASSEGAPALAPVTLRVESDTGTLKISNTDLHFRARVFQYTRTFKDRLKKGEYPLCKGTITLRNKL